MGLLKYLWANIFPNHVPKYIENVKKRGAICDTFEKTLLQREL